MQPFAGAAASKPGGARAIAAAPLTRGRLFFWLFLLAALNSITTLAAIDRGGGWFPAIFGLLGISAIVWLALLAGLRLLWNDGGTDPPSRRDTTLALMAVAAILLPPAGASGLALTALAFYGIATSVPGSPLRRASIVFLALSGTTLWGRLLLAFFAQPLLRADTFLVASISGLASSGNVLHFADGTGGVAVASGCSSLQGISLALLFWATLNQWYGVSITRRSLGWAGAAVAATVAVNVLRIAALGRFPAYFDEIHTGIGWHVAAWTTLILVVSICLYGARDAVFHR